MSVTQTELIKSKTRTKIQKTKKPEPEICSVCINNYTPIIRKKCICKYCKADTCSKCIERYLLGCHEDAHCLHCRVNYNDTTLSEICTKTFIQHDYFKHRQEVLINRERANLPGLQDAAINERIQRENQLKINEIKKDIAILKTQYDITINEYNILYRDYVSKLVAKQDYSVIKEKCDDLNNRCENIAIKIKNKDDDIYRIRFPISNGVNKSEEEKKKFIRRCTRDGCQGILSTAWKCGICDFYSCSKCFVTKTKERDDPHECKKEDIETADMIKADCKPCPNCGEFIQKSSGCDMMWCISCKTPFSWNSGKVIISGHIHNPHYYEWMQRNGGGAVPRNPADIPCGGYPHMYDILIIFRNINKKVSKKFFEFHRICGELQDISEHTYRTHIDQDSTTNIKFLLGDYDEKHWGQLLGKNERKRKRDREVQEIFAAFRMVAVELINRVYNYRTNYGTHMFFVIPKEVEKYMNNLNVEIEALITMINDAFRNVSITHCYSVPYIHFDGLYYSIKTKNFSDEVKKKRGTKNNDTTSTVSTQVASAIAPLPILNNEAIKSNAEEASNKIIEEKRKKPQVAPEFELADEDMDLQAAIVDSLKSN